MPGVETPVYWYWAGLARCSSHACVVRPGPLFFSACIGPASPVLCLCVYWAGLLRYVSLRVLGRPAPLCVSVCIGPAWRGKQQLSRGRGEAAGHSGGQWIHGHAQVYLVGSLADETKTGCKMAGQNSSKSTAGTTPSEGGKQFEMEAPLLQKNSKTGSTVDGTVDKAKLIAQGSSKKSLLGQLILKNTQLDMGLKICGALLCGLTTVVVGLSISELAKVNALKLRLQSQEDKLKTAEETIMRIKQKVDQVDGRVKAIEPEYRCNCPKHAPEAAVPEKEVETVTETLLTPEEDVDSPGSTWGLAALKKWLFGVGA